VRVVAGRWRGRPLRAPKDDRVRPTADKVRQAWLNILRGDVVGARVLDLFAGSGALGIEALSQGAATCDFVELNAASLRALGDNLAALGAAPDEARVRRGDALRFVEALGPLAYDVAFADPPYSTDAARRVAERWAAVPFAAVLGVEHDARTPLPGGGETRRYGTTAITFFRVAAGALPGPEMAPEAASGVAPEATRADRPDGPPADA
jgi:16S rRNA (guanine966-N2)-methyltransferase